MPKLDPPTATVDHCHYIDFSLPLHRRSIQPIMFYFEVVKTCFLLSLISMYCSLFIRFNCSWNFVSLWLWVAMDLSFFVFVFMEFCWFVVVGCSGFKFFFVFVFFFCVDFHVFFFLLCCQIYGKEESRNFCNQIFFFPFFFVCNFYWIFGFLGFFYLVLILGLFQLIYSVFLIFILHWFGFSFSLFLVMQFLLDFCFLGFFYLISILGLFWSDIQSYCSLHLHWFFLFINYYNLQVFLNDNLWNVMLGLPLFWILWEFFLKVGVVQYSCLRLLNMCLIECSGVCSLILLCQFICGIS